VVDVGLFADETTMLAEELCLLENYLPELILGMIRGDEESTDE